LAADNRSRKELLAEIEQLRIRLEEAGEAIAAESLDRSIIEQAGEAIIVCDAEGRIIRASRQAQRLCAEEPLLKEFNDLFQLRITETDRMFSVLTPLNGECFESVEVQFNRSDGELFYLLLNATPLRGVKEHIVGCVVTLTDFTKQREPEADIHEAKEKADTATMVKGQFLANMSHELRTPMTGVLGMLDLALLGNLEEQEREFIRIAQTSARSLVRILNDILDMTRIEMGKLNLEKRPFSLRRCLANMVNILLPVAMGKGLDLQLKVDEDVPETMVGDQMRINQVLTNLAGNAVKFTGKGKVELRVSAGGTRAGGKREIIFTVTDTGIGIPDDMREHIFQSFTQADESYTRRYGGTGLGLAISRELVQRMGGTITLKSEVGNGSVFSCAIPLGEAKTGRGATIAQERRAAIDAVPRGREKSRARILVAEDDQVARQVIGLMLQRSGYELDFANCGRKAVDMWDKGGYDLILMDVQMPQMNGFEATAAIRKKERSRGGHIPIVAMTAHALKEDEERCLASGMDDYVSKPINFEKCLAVIGEVLGKGASET
jgi:PAS domain S-box-containing protein